MANKQPPAKDAEKAEEARHVAEDALEAAQQGETEEARFLAGEAKSLDPEAASDVLAKANLHKKAAKP